MPTGVRQLVRFIYVGIHDFGGIFSKFVVEKPSIFEDVNALYKSQQAITLDMKLTQPKSDMPFSIYVQTNENNIAGSLFQRDEHGKAFFITLINHRFPDSVKAKEENIKKLYRIYFIVKRYKNILFGRPIISDPEIKTILSRHRDAIYLLPLLGKWATLIGCFRMQYGNGGDREPKKLIDFLVKYDLIPLKAVKKQVLKKEVIPLVEAGNVVEKAQLYRLNSIKLSLMEYADTISGTIKNIEILRANDALCKKITNELKEAPKENSDFILEGNKLLRIVEDERVFVGPTRALSAGRDYGLPQALPPPRC